MTCIVDECQFIYLAFLLLKMNRFEIYKQLNFELGIKLRIHIFGITSISIVINVHSWQYSINPGFY